MPRLAGAHGDVSPEDGNKRTKIMLIALAAVVILAAVFWFLIKPSLSKSSDNSSATAAPAGAAAPAAPRVVKPTAKPTPSPSPSPSPEAISDSTRDPFSPLPAELVGDSTSSSTSATTATAAAPAVPQPSVTANPNPTPTPSSAAAAGSHSVTLVTTSNGVADLTVDGKDATGKAGATIGKGISLVKVTDDSVFITFQSKAYALAPGQTVTF